MGIARVYLAPGMFGFARLAGFEYFQHVERALAQRFGAADREVEIRVVDVHPTASIRRRAGKLAALVSATAGSDGGPIHLVGHSTGGLDARLVASPGVRLDHGAGPPPAWSQRIRSVTTVNTPHQGTPLASFFATAKGQRLLYAVCAATVTGLRLGALPATAAAALVASLGRSREATAVEPELVDRIVDAVVRVLDEASSAELRAWLRQVRDDQGGVVQLMPEAMDLFQAAVRDQPGVRYACVASYAPPRRARDWLRSLRSPSAAASAGLFYLLQRVTSVEDASYPCRTPDGAAATLRAALGALPPPGANDGVVPLRSQLWGRPAWIGQGDHLDVIGHFRGRGAHTDWLSSGSRFDLARFETLMDRVAAELLEAEGAGPGAAG